MEHLTSRIAAGLGLVGLMGIALLLSTDRRAAVRRWPLIAWAIALQFVFGYFVLNTGAGRALFNWLNDAFIAVVNVVGDGTKFVFGPLIGGNPDGEVATVDFVAKSIDAVNATDATAQPINGIFVFAFAVLPTIIFFSALSSILYHLNILQTVVKGIALVMLRTLKTSGAETLSASANIFVGQTEAPLLVKPYLTRMTRSELMTVMTGGFATVAGGVMAFYVLMLESTIPGIAGHLLAASVMSAPAALLFGKLMVPETETPETAGRMDVTVECESVNLVEAATIGTTDGLKLALNVGAMLISFIALIALFDLMLVGIAGMFISGELPAWLNLRGLLGYLFLPFGFLLGITDWNEAVIAGRLLGVKMVATELVAYADLAKVGATEALSERTRTILAYALCGFANFGSIGIQIGGLAAIAPDRRSDLARLGLRAMFAGTLAAIATGCIAAILI